MTHDQNKKSLRHFQCRDYLWEIFEQMSAELECSTDYLINEAMRQYARSRNYGTRASGPAPSAPPNRTPRPDMAPPSPGAIPSLRTHGGGRPAIPSAPPPPPQRPGYGGGYGPSPPTPMGQMGGGSAYPPPSGPVGHQPGYGAPPPAMGSPYGAPPDSYPPMPTHRPPGYGSPSGAPPPLPGTGRGPAMGGPPMGSLGMPSLFVIFNGQKIPVNKAEFVIGRGSKTADLPIKDGNISRRHAAIVFENGAFWMRDLGSTNGVEYGGRRVDIKQIEEGDVYQLCDYELRFTYR